MLKKEIVNGIEYSRPQVVLLTDTGIGNAEFAARTCYDSFDKSNNDTIKYLGTVSDYSELEPTFLSNCLSDMQDVENSELLEQLSFVHFHHSVLEHVVMSFLIKGTSRGVLQEHARHRVQSLSVRSTRYTMSDIINAYIACYRVAKDYNKFYEIISELDLFVTTNPQYNNNEISAMWNKLSYQLSTLGLDEFLNISLTKDNKELYFSDNYSKDDARELFNLLQKGKKKRNVGDSFKHIVTDNWKVDMVVTFNLRSLKNYLDLRDSGAAFFQIRWLAEEIKNQMPERFKRLVFKK